MFYIDAPFFSTCSLVQHLRLILSELVGSLVIDYGVILIGGVVVPIKSGVKLVLIIFCLSVLESILKHSIFS